MNLVEKLELKISWLLDGWQLELISAEHVQQLAEKWMTETSDVIDIDQGMAVIEVLSQLDILNQQLIIQDDIPAMRQYLQQEKTNPIAAREEWLKYWEAVDSDERARLLASNGFYAC